jgi:Flp pilus assembly protein TadD
MSWRKYKTKHQALKAYAALRRRFFAGLFFFCCCAVFAQNRDSRPWWYMLEQGKLKFRAGDYGGALLDFEDARRQRLAEYELMEDDFINLLSLGEVRRLGDDLDRIETFARERHYTAAMSALTELFYRIPKESFNNSAQAALTALGNLKYYPEAEYWLGETYFAESEIALALNQFRKALDHRELFENPGFETDLRYRIAGILKITQEYNEMERTLLSILAADSLWTGGADAFVRQAMSRTLENPKEGIGRFLNLYRFNNPQTEEAHRLLGYYYYQSGRHSRAQEHLMFAFLYQNTIIIEEVIRCEYNFTFTTLEDLAVKIDRYPLLVEYVEKIGYYKTAYYLGAALFGNGKGETAASLWRYLSSRSDAGEWQNRAAAQLRSPHIERAVEMP